VDDVGFTLISLAEGFVIVAAIDLGLPGWAVALTAVAVLVPAIAAVNRVKRRLAEAVPHGTHG